MSDTWISYTFKVKDRAFKAIRPLDMHIRKEYDRVRTGFLKSEKKETGRFILSIKYDRGPLTHAQTTHIFFESEDEAQLWFDFIFRKTFLSKEKGRTPPPPPPKDKVTRLKPKKGKKGTPLRLL
jgi:hypothetical protein